MEVRTGIDPNAEHRRIRGKGTKEETRKHLMLPPDVEVEGDVGLDPQLVVLRRLEYTFVRAVKVLEQLAVQEPAVRERRVINHVLQLGSRSERSAGEEQRSISTGRIPSWR